MALRVVRQAEGLPAGGGAGGTADNVDALGGPVLAFSRFDALQQVAGLAVKEPGCGSRCIGCRFTLLSRRLAFIGFALLPGGEDVIDVVGKDVRQVVAEAKTRFR